MIFFTKILAITATSVSVNTMATANISTKQQEQKNILNTAGWNKEQLIQKISELRHEIDKINLYEKALKSGKVDTSEQEEALSDLTAWTEKQKHNISRLADAIEMNSQAIKNKSKFIEILNERAGTFGERIRLKKIEITSLTNKKADTAMLEDLKAIIQKKQEEKKDVLAKIRVINKKVLSSKIKIDEKTEEIIGLQNKLNKSLKALSDINSSIKQSTSDKKEIFIDLHELFTSSIESVDLYNSSLIAAKKEKIQIESELEHFWVATALKKIEYKNRVKAIKKEVQGCEDKQSSIINDYNRNNRNKAKQLNELLISSEILYRNMLNAIQDKKREIIFHEENNNKLHDSFVLNNQKLAAGKIEQLETSSKEMRQNIIENELEISNNVRNSLIQEKHWLEKELAELSAK